jgi:hypothetical protein
MRGPALYSLFLRARNGMSVSGVLLGWHEPVGADAMSGLVIAFVELLNRDALLIGRVDQGTFSCVHNLGMEHLSSTPEVVDLESMTRSVIDGHSESQTISSTAVEGFGRPSGPARATAGKCCALHPAPSVKGRRRRASHRCSHWSRMILSFAPSSRVNVRSRDEGGRDGSPRCILP